MDPPSSRASPLQARDTAMPKMDPLAASKWLPLPKAGNMGGNMSGGFGGEVWFKSESPQPALSSAPAATLAPAALVPAAPVPASVQTLAPVQAAPAQSCATSCSAVPAPVQPSSPVQSVAPVVQSLAPVVQSVAPVQSVVPVQPVAPAQPTALAPVSPAATISQVGGEPKPTQRETQWAKPVAAAQTSAPAPAPPAATHPQVGGELKSGQRGTQWAQPVAAAQTSAPAPASPAPTYPQVGGEPMSGQREPGPPAGSSGPHTGGWPKPSPQEGQSPERCFKTADEATICVTDKTWYKNDTKVFEQDGVSDRHNDYGSASKHDAAGIIPGHNITEAGHGHGESAGRAGETKFDSHDFKENDGFRDTHSEEPNPQNGTKFKFEDHKEDSARSGKDVQVHSSDPNGERVDGNGHYFKESHDGVDVKDVNGATDTVHKNTSGTEFNGMFQKHHAGPDNSDAHDSKLTHSGALDSQHQKEEHKDPNLHTMHETSSGKGTWSFNMVGNNALGDLAQESKNWPEQGQMSQTGKPGWGNSLPKNEGEMNEASKVDWGNTPSKRSDAEMLVERPHYSNPLLPEPLRILPPTDEKVVEKRQSVPKDPEEKVPECCRKGNSQHPSGTVPKPKETPSSTIENGVFESKDAQGNIKHYYWRSGQSIEDMQKSAVSATGDDKLVEKRASDAKDPKGCKCKAMQSGSLSKSLLPPSDEALVEKRASGPEDPEEDVPECCKHKGKHHSAHMEMQPPRIQPPSDANLFEKRESTPTDSGSPAEKAKGGGALGPGAYFVPTVPDLPMDSAPTPEELQADSREHLPTTLGPKYVSSDRVVVVAGEKQILTPAEMAAAAPLRDISKAKPKHPKMVPEAGSMPFGPGSHPEKRSDIDEMLVHKHKFNKLDHTTESKMPPSKRSENDDEAVLDLPGHPYLVGHAAADAVQAKVRPTTVDALHVNAAAYDQAASPTCVAACAPPTQLAARSPAEWEETNDAEIPIAADPQFSPIHSKPHRVNDKTDIFVMPTREHASHTDDARLNTIQICSAVVMALCLALCLGFLVWWVPRKVRARRTRKRAAAAEMEQRDVELAELNEELDREVVDAAAGAKKEGGK